MMRRILSGAAIASALAVATAGTAVADVAGIHNNLTGFYGGFGTGVQSTERSDFEQAPLGPAFVGSLDGQSFFDFDRDVRRAFPYLKGGYIWENQELFGRAGSFGLEAGGGFGWGGTDTDEQLLIAPPGYYGRFVYADGSGFLPILSAEYVDFEMMVDEYQLYLAPSFQFPVSDNLELNVNAKAGFWGAMVMTDLDFNTGGLRVEQDIDLDQYGYEFGFGVTPVYVIDRNVQVFTGIYGGLMGIDSDLEVEQNIGGGRIHAEDDDFKVAYRLGGALGVRVKPPFLENGVVDFGIGLTHVSDVPQAKMPSNVGSAASIGHSEQFRANFFVGVKLQF